MSKEVLQITISKSKIPTSKIGKWFYWNVYFIPFKIWRPKLMSKIYLGLSNICLAILPKAEREKILKEFEEVTVIIKD